MAALAVFAALIGLGTSGVAWGDALDPAVVPVRAPDTVAPLPPGVPPTGPAGSDGSEDDMPQPVTFSGDEGGGDSPTEP
ncbi:hypothetical protein ACFWAY_05700 [Rhodococcus sp. NPDC059968]|uniref:hypothetical protein n=1 Tax=Rhodococcus sp. NPDC059968 TaxID=3347017 RepID=UPI00366D4224